MRKLNDADPILTALTSALAADVVSNRSHPGSATYQALKTAIGKKFGAKSDIVTAIDLLEEKPKSNGRRQVVNEEIASVAANQDPQLLSLAWRLLDSVKPRPAYQIASKKIPLQCPPQADYFFGRAAEVQEILAALQPGQVLLLSGPAGIGKSALIAAVLRKLTASPSFADLFVDGLIYHNFYNQPRVDIAFEQMIKAFGEEALPTAYDAAERILADRQALLVLDSIDWADDLPGFLEMSANCGVVVISDQAQHENINGVTYSVSSLPAGEGAKLFQAWGETDAADEANARKICELVGNSPLSIRLAGHFVATQTQKGADYLSWLEYTPLADMNEADRVKEGLRFVLEQSLSQMSDLARQIFTIVGVLAPVSFDQEVIVDTLTKQSRSGLLSSIKNIFKHKTKIESGEINAALRELNSYGLLWWTDHRYEVSHPLLHQYAKKHYPASAGLIRGLTNYYTTLAWEQSAFGHNGFVRLDLERPHMMRILVECLEREEWEGAHGLAAAVEDYLDQQGHIVERVVANEAGLVAAWQLGRHSEGAWLGNLGDVYRTMGHTKWAIEHFKKALETAKQNGDPYGQGNSLGNLGLAYRDLGQIEQAKTYLRQSQVIFDSVNSPSASLVRDWLAELEAWDEE